MWISKKDFEILKNRIVDLEQFKRFVLDKAKAVELIKEYNQLTNTEGKCYFSTIGKIYIDYDCFSPYGVETFEGEVICALRKRKLDELMATQKKDKK